MSGDRKHPRYKLAGNLRGNTKILKEVFTRSLQLEPANTFLLFLAIIGFPTVAFASYVFFSGVPFDFIGPSDAATFSFSLYILLILSLIFARVTIFLAVTIHTAVIVTKNYGRFASGVGTKKIKTKIDHLITSGKKNGFDTAILRATNDIMLRHEKWFLVKKVRISSAAFNRLNSKASIVINLAIALFIFCYTFSGFHLFLYLLWLNILIGFMVSLYGGPNSALAPFIERSIYKYIIDRLPGDYHDQDPKYKKRGKKTRKRRIGDRSSRILFQKLRNWASDANAKMEDLASILGRARLIGLFASLLAILVGASKAEQASRRFNRVVLSGNEICAAYIFVSDRSAVIRTRGTDDVQRVPTSDLIVTTERCPP